MTQPSKREVDPGADKSAVDRRDFILRALTAALGLPAVGALLAGCEGRTYTGEILQPDGGGGATDLAAARAIVEAVRDQVMGVNAPTNAQLVTWLGQLNGANSTVHRLFANAPAAQIHANVPEDLTPVIQQLTGWGLSMDLSGPAAQYTVDDLAAAAQRAFTLLGEYSAAERRLLWVYMLGVCLLVPHLDDATICAMAQAGSQEDTQGYGAQLYDMVFAQSSAVQTTGSASLPFNSMMSMVGLLIAFLLMALASETISFGGMLLGGMYFAILMVFLLFMFASMFHYSSD